MRCLEAEYLIAFPLGYDSLCGMYAQNEWIFHIVTCPETSFEIRMRDLPRQAGRRSAPRRFPCLNPEG